jgi:hypothetical protein
MSYGAWQWVDKEFQLSRNFCSYDEMDNNPHSCFHGYLTRLANFAFKYKVCTIKWYS